MKTKVTFYGGLTTIGGVVMAIEYGKERVLLEMGTAYDPSTDFFDGAIKHRRNSYVYDELVLKRAPRIDGIYAKKDLKDLKLIAAEDTDIHTSVFISHLHLDHMSCMGFLSDLVDIYVSEPAQVLESALETVGHGIYNARNVDFKVLDPQKEYQLGEITLKPFLLNDKSYQDYSFYVKTPDLKLHYTGDLMLHGAYVDTVFKEMEYIKQEHVDVLVPDCTTFMDNTMSMIYGDPNAVVMGQRELPAGMLDKEMVDLKLEEMLKEQAGLCVFNFYEREMIDVECFERMAKNTNRLIAYEPETAYLIYKFFKRDVNVFLVDYDEYQTKSWFKELEEHMHIIDLKDVWLYPQRYLLQTTYERSYELFDLPKGISYLHAGGTPIGAFDPAYGRLLKLLEDLEIKHVNFFMDNYFTHAYPSQVQYYCDEIDAKVLIPTHGKNPERLKPINGRQQLLPKLGVTYIFNGERMVEEDED